MCIVRSRGIAFMSDDIARTSLKLSPNGISAPIFKVVCPAYGLIVQSTSCALN